MQLFSSAVEAVASTRTAQGDGAVPIGKQLLTTQSPAAREGAGIAYDPASGHVIIFGGENSNVTINDTWELIP
jgi:hypothetical protein